MLVSSIADLRRCSWALRPRLRRQRRLPSLAGSWRWERHRGVSTETQLMKTSGQNMVPQHPDFNWAEFHRTTFRAKLPPRPGLINAPYRMADAVPIRAFAPKPQIPIEVMVIKICPKTGDGVVRFHWRTKRVVRREFLVSGALPGDVVAISFGSVRVKDYPRGEIDLIVNQAVSKIRPSRWEVRPPCPHYLVCGGCDFLNLSYGRQLVEKQRWVDSVVAKAKVPASALRRIRPSEPQARFAERTEWFFSEREGVLCFGPANAKSSQDEENEPFEVTSSCVRPPRAVTKLLAGMFDALHELRQSRGHFHDYSIYEELRGKGMFRSAVVLCTRPPRDAETPADDAKGWVGTELLLNIVVAQDVNDVQHILQPFVDAALDAVGPRRLVGVVANLARSKWTVMGGRRELLLYGRRYARQALELQVGGIHRSFKLHMGAASRLLIHTRALPDLARAVLDMCELRETDTVWHCFCGGGEFALVLGAACEHVVAIGTNAMEVSELKRNLAANASSNITAVLTNLRSPWTLKQLSFHISQSQQRRLLLGTGEEQAKARDYAVSTFVPGEGRRRLLQRLSAAPFTAPLLRQDALAQRELRTLLPAFVRDFRPSTSTMPVPVPGSETEGAAEEGGREVPPEMESKLKRLYRRLALKYHPDKNPNDPEASERFQALTRAYRALVGDTAGPEEGDDDVVDPFLQAKASKWKPKFKDRWRDPEFEKRRVGSSVPRKESKFAEFFGEGITGTPRTDDGESSEEDEDFAVKMEIDETWAAPEIPAPSTPPPPPRAPPTRQPPEEIVLREGPDGLTTSGDGAPVPTLPPPDVIVVSQPKARRHGVGTLKHFHSWLRSTAVRTIVYLSQDPDAFGHDMNALLELGYRVQRVQPFDPEPHRRSVLLVARLELIRPLVGSEDYGPEGDRLLGSEVALLPGAGEGRVPLLGDGGYKAIPAP